MITHDISASLGLDGKGNRDYCPFCTRLHLFNANNQIVICPCGATMVLRDDEVNGHLIGTWIEVSINRKAASDHFDDLPYTN